MLKSIDNPSNFKLGARAAKQNSCWSGGALSLQETSAGAVLDLPSYTTHMSSLRMLFLDRHAAEGEESVRSCPHTGVLDTRTFLENTGLPSLALFRVCW